MCIRDRYEEVAVIVNEIITKDVPIAELVDYNVGGVLEELYENIKGNYSLEPLAELTKKAIKKLKEEAFELLFCDSNYSKVSSKENDIHLEPVSNSICNTHNEISFPVEAKNPNATIEQNVATLHHANQEKESADTLKETRIRSVDTSYIKDKELNNMSTVSYTHLTLPTICSV
eukprot:TRINITY_DN20745_c0_g1_i1.p1 TRINITY_DN20745_c0_g1~~TRINITY_DN20745_c0_g1_i1.p1  ORF type:complete len:174 (-),score=41.83 TRINITY_DN20745_c0_g1_i1:34-555(-)